MPKNLFLTEVLLTLLAVGGLALESVQADPLSAGVQVGVPNQEEILIILDASGSMADPLEEGKPLAKMDAAKRVLKQALQQLPPDAKVGLRVYGNPQGFSFDPCRASRLEVPIATGTAMTIAQRAQTVRPYGATPISYSLQEAALKDFSRFATKKTVILISDGEETCDADPCAVSVALTRQNVHFQVNVIGFGALSPQATQQLKCVAASTFGRYTQATTSAQLANQLGKVLKAEKSVNAQIVLPDGSMGATSSERAPAPLPSSEKPARIEPSRLPPARKAPAKDGSIDLRQYRTR